MINIPCFTQNIQRKTQKAMTQLTGEIKIQQEQQPIKIQFHHGSGSVVGKQRTEQDVILCKEQTVLHLTPKTLASFEFTKPTVITHSQVQKTPTQIVEENYAKSNTNFKPQINQFTDCTWFLPRHPNSLFKTIPTKQKLQRKRISKKVLAAIPVGSVISTSANGQGEVKQQPYVKCQDQVILPKPSAKTKAIHKNPNFKPRKGKNQQPMVQKLIKKLSGFHYNKNYKQNRNKTLKKLAKRGLAINAQNFSQYLQKLKLQINKKFTKPSMRPKTNTKGEQINPKKSYDSYHNNFPHPRQRDFIQRFYNQVFKRVYVIMWKSDERLKRIDSIKIEGVNYDNNMVETDYFSEVKVQDKQEVVDDREGGTESRVEDKRAMFVQCLDEEGKFELDRVFDEEYHRLYEEFVWGDFLVQPDKDSFRQRLEKFCWIDP